MTEKQAAELGINFVDDDGAASGKSSQREKIESWCKQHGFNYDKLNNESLATMNLNVDRLKDKDLKNFQNWLANSDDETKGRFK